MDKGKVVTSVVASAITAIVLYLGALVFKLITVHLNPTDIPAVARAFVNDDDAREVLLRYLALDEKDRFRGPEGPTGPQGEQGIPGPPSSVPIGAVMAFDSVNGCPSGWTNMGETWRGRSIIAAVEDPEDEYFLVGPAAPPPTRSLNGKCLPISIRLLKQGAIQYLSLVLAIAGQQVCLDNGSTIEQV